MNSLVISIFVGLAMSQAEGAERGKKTDDVSKIQAEAAGAADFARQETENWQVFVEGADRQKAELRPDPILRWSNPAVGRVYGSVFVWTSAGRPVAVASIYRWYVPYLSKTAEFVSLSPQGLTAERRGKKMWKPAAGQVKWQRLEAMPAPSATSKQRLTQMRRLARDFVPELTDSRVVGEGTAQQLRLMDQPVYQYGQGPNGLLDGALFAFVMGTDPEVLLLLEARESSDGREWHYALARMNSDAMSVRCQDREVWTVPHLDKPGGDLERDYLTIELGPKP